MCDPVSALVAVAATVEIVGGIKQAQAATQAGNTARHEGQLKKKSANIAAENTRKNALIKVANIRKQSVVYQAVQVAGQAASGAIVGDGSTQAMIDHTISLANQDAIATIYTAKSRAKAIKRSGDIALIDANARADSIKKQGVASLLQSIGSATIGALGVKR